MVQIGNEIDSHISGVSISNWARFAGFVNAGTKAVRETDPRIIIVEQHGRPAQTATSFRGFSSSLPHATD